MAPKQLSMKTRHSFIIACALSFAQIILADNPQGMVWIPGGQFTMGSDRPGAYRPEQPAHEVKVSGFWMDETEVTNAQFKRFVDATGYVTTAEKAPVLVRMGDLDTANTTFDTVYDLLNILSEHRTCFWKNKIK